MGGEVSRYVTWTPRLMVVHLLSKEEGTKFRGGAGVAMVWVTDDEAIYISSFVSQGDVKWVVGFTALEFRAEVWVGETNLRRLQVYRW